MRAQRKRRILPCAFDINITGIPGRFDITRATPGVSADDSIPVHYLQTTLRIAGSLSTAQTRLIEHLRPVREALNLERLSFGEIMQRDIDDARVSLELIPYLLGRTTGSTIRFFPPIIVALLPVDSDDTPADHYPEVVEEDVPDDDGDLIRHTRAGPLGAEVFEFRQLLEDGVPSEHNNAELRINSTTCKLVIIDGQHRAMALLAVYRNLKNWPQGTQDIERYYKRWSPALLNEYDLDHIQLPVVFCAFPELHHPDAVLKVHEACRELFLALNKNARKVSRARNYLLDDTDAISEFLRTTLDTIKQRTTGQLRLWNVELDSALDRVALKRPVAITGVMHLYTIIQFMFINDTVVSGISHPRKSKWLFSRKPFNSAVKRLHLADRLGATAQVGIRRDRLSREHLALFREAYAGRYSDIVVLFLERFWPYEAHNDAAFKLAAQLEGSSTGSTARAVLFGGHGIGRSFKMYLKRIREEVADYGKGEAVPQALLDAKIAFEAKAEDLDNQTRQLKQNHVREWLLGCPGKFVDAWQSQFQELFRDTLTTIAFQKGLMLAFFTTMETLEAQRQDDIFTRSDTNELALDYLDSLHQLFKCSKELEPRINEKRAKNLLRVVVGRIKKGSLMPRTGLKSILISGELKPDEWVKFRYMCLELWCRWSAREDVRQLLQPELLTSRTRILENYEEREIKQHCNTERILRKDLSAAKERDLKERCWQYYRDGLSALLDCKKSALPHPVDAIVLLHDAELDDEELDEADEVDVSSAVTDETIDASVEEQAGAYAAVAVEAGIEADTAVAAASIPVAVDLNAEEDMEDEDAEEEDEEDGDEYQ